MQQLDLQKAGELLQRLAASAQKANFSPENLSKLLEMLQISIVVDLADSVLDEAGRQQFREDMKNEATLAPRVSEIQTLVKQKLSPEIMATVVQQNWQRMVETLSGQLSHGKSETVIEDIQTCAAELLQETIVL